MAEKSKITQDHKKIRKWVEKRDGSPACVKGTGSSKDAGLLRINFPGYAEENLKNISWEEFFEKFDENNLAFLYQKKLKGGEISRFNKIISMEDSSNENEDDQEEDNEDDSENFYEEFYDENKSLILYIGVGMGAAVLAYGLVTAYRRYLR